MNPYTKSAALSAMIFAGALLSQPSRSQTPPASGGNAAPKSSSSSMPAGGMDMKAMMKDSSDKMASMQMTGKPDIDFAMMMRIHHQGAVEMAKTELKDGNEPQMKKMAKGIISAQKREIADFDKFLAKHGHPMEKMSK